MNIRFLQSCQMKSFTDAMNGTNAYLKDLMTFSSSQESFNASIVRELKSIKDDMNNKFDHINSALDKVCLPYLSYI